MRSAQLHLIDDGYFEGRLPFLLLVGEKWYLQQKRDGADRLRQGALRFGQAHCDEDGYREGRRPFAM